MEPRHPQVPVLDFQCDEEIAELILLMNTCGIDTLQSCQDNNAGRGTVRRVWVQICSYDLLTFLELLDQPAEAADDAESLSSRIAAEYARTTGRRTARIAAGITRPTWRGSRRVSPVPPLTSRLRGTPSGGGGQGR